jgi:hypothetical protein
MEATAEDGSSVRDGNAERLRTSAFGHKPEGHGFTKKLPLTGEACIECGVLGARLRRSASGSRHLGSRQVIKSLKSWAWVFAPLCRAASSAKKRSPSKAALFLEDKTSCRD